MHDYQVNLVLRIKAELGECPLWSAEDQRLYWLDIENSTINQYDSTTGKNRPWMLPAHPGCFAFRDGGGAVIAAGDGIYDIDFAAGTIRHVVAATHDAARLCFNDGRTDRQGRLWASTVRADKQHVFNTSENAFYRFDGRSLDKIIGGPVGLTNGTAFSPDGKTMYRAESDSGRIFAYDYDLSTGTPSHERVFAVVPPELGVPDGATVDDEGAYWVALPAGLHGGIGKVGRYTPDGRLDLHFEVPTPMPTMVAFGGPNLSTLYITSGRGEAWMKYRVPDTAGSLFAVETNFCGVPETKFHYR